MNSPTVSIVIPVFNRSHLVRKAIDSALAQTHPCEVILVDHGSTDDIETVVISYGNKIRYIRKDIDNGPIAAWRDGVEHATGEYLHFTYDDDWIEPEFIQECLKHFSPEVAFVYTRAYLWNDGTSEPHLKHPQGSHKVSYIAKYLLTIPLTISPGCALFRRNDVLDNLLHSVPGADGTYGKNTGVGEDALLFLLTTLNYKYYVHIPKALAGFLSHDGSITIDAISSGKRSLLEASYYRAKEFYLSKTNSVPRPRGIEIFIFKIQWALLRIISRAFHQS